MKLYALGLDSKYWLLGAKLKFVPFRTFLLELGGFPLLEVARHSQRLRFPPGHTKIPKLQVISQVCTHSRGCLNI